MNTETRVGLFIIVGIGIFLYLSIHIGEIKLNKNEYSVYKAYFDETGGLETKSPVKMAGVSVGWVDGVSLLPGGKAEIIMRVKSIHKLGKNAFARISQEGLIGTKTIEIDPGDSSSGYLSPGSILPMPGRTPTTVSGLLEHFKDISNNIGDVTLGLKEMVATAEAEDRIKKTLRNVQQTSSNVSSITQHANDILGSHKEHVSTTLQNLPGAVSNIDDAAVQAKDMFREADEVIEKINNGQGLLGKLVNEAEIYADIRKTVQGIKSYVHKTQSLSIKVDGHLESMLDGSDRKGYVNMTLFTHSDFFYSIGLMSGKVGKFTRQTHENKYYDRAGNEILLPLYPELPDYEGVSPFQLAAYAAQVRHVSYTPSKPLIEAQVGKRFNNLTFRTGQFEDTFGVGIDYDMPTGSTRFGWKMSIEAFDFNGHNRRNDDRRMHIKWLNRISYMHNIYSVFGLDDVVGMTTASPFFGVGLSFNDDDLKYLLPSFMSLK